MLEFDVSTINIIKRKFRDDPEECYHLLQEWVTTIKGVEPRNWATLLAFMKNVPCLMNAAQQIENDLRQLPVTMYVYSYQMHEVFAMSDTVLFINRESDSSSSQRRCYGTMGDIRQQTVYVLFTVRLLL